MAHAVEKLGLGEEAHPHEGVPHQDNYEGQQELHYSHDRHL